MILLREPSFSKNALDRMEHLRVSIASVALTASDATSVFILVSEDKLIVHEKDMDYLFSSEDLALMGITQEHSLFLGVFEEKYYFVRLIDPVLGEQFKSIDLRSWALLNLTITEGMGLFAQAFSLLKWQETHAFCPNCGSKNKLMQAGWRQDCLSCGKQHFPRVDPVVIMLVTHGEHCLLGAGLSFKYEHYSCLAGFIEPGETIEDAARRELFEEAGVRGLEVEYILSQPWPFPFSLMIGVQVNAEDKVLTIDKNELLDARWVHKSDLAAVLNGATDRGFTLPAQIAIARSLLEYWVTT